MNVQHVPARTAVGLSSTASLRALAGIPAIKAGDDLSSVIVTALNRAQEAIKDGDVVVIAQKIVSKAQDRQVLLNTVTPSPQAEDLAHRTAKDPRLVELILRESTEVIRAKSDILIVAHRLGFIAANACIDQSNVDHSGGESALLLPENPDQTCAELRIALKRRTGIDVAVIINDSHGRAFRRGTVGVAVGASGLPTLKDLRGHTDLFGRRLQSTEVALADEIASAASLLMGQSDESRPIVIVRGIPITGRDGTVAELLRPAESDLFRAATLDMALTGRRSVRHFATKPVSKEIIERLLQAAITAPSAHNRQPWRFAVLTNEAHRQKLAVAMGEKLRDDRTRDGADPAAIAADVARSVSRITGAPVVILACVTMADMDRYAEPHRNDAEQQMAIQSTAMAVENLLLAAHAAGLGSTFMCAPLFCPDLVRGTLDLPTHWVPQGLITLGYPVGSTKSRDRRPLSDVVRYIGGDS